MPKHRMRTWLRVTGAVAAISGLLGPTTTARGATVGTPRTTVNAPLGDPAPAQGRDVAGVATDPRNSVHVVEIDEDFLRGQCTFRTTFDGGTTWAGGSLMVAGAPEAGDDPVVAARAQAPCDAFDSGGFAHFGQSVAFGSGQNVYTAFSSANSVVVAHSSDGGRSWATGSVAVGAPPGARPFDVRPQLAVDPGDNGDRIYVSASALALIGPTQGGGPPDGTGGGDSRRRLVTTRSDDSGTTWSPVVEIQGADDDVREQARPLVGPEGTVYTAWRNGPGAGEIVVARSADRGATWTRNRVGSAGGGFPSLGVEASPGTLDLVYRGEHDGGTDISFSRSTDGGATWSSPRRVSDDASRDDTRHFVPRLSPEAHGRLDVVWMDTRSSYSSPVPYGDIWYSSSGDGGESFTANRRVNDHSLNLGPGAIDQSPFARSGPVVTPLGDSRLLFAWGDSRNGGTGTGVDADVHAGSDVYMATMDLAANGPVPASGIPDAAPEALSVELSRLAFPGGPGRPGSQRATKVVVVNATDDTGVAYCAAVLARASESPLLLARSTDLTSEQKNEVSRLAPGGAYLVGAASRLSDKVESSLTAAGATDTQRIAGSDSTDTARRIALLLDPRDPDARTRGAPAFDGAVIVNSQTGDAATGSALAATLRMPVLFTQRDALPRATTEALQALGIRTTLVVGGPASVGDAVVSALPGARRLGGDDPTETSEAVAVEARARNVAANVVYVTDGERPIDQAALGATVARIGGLMLAEPDASAPAARRSLDKLSMTGAVDRLVVVRSNTAGTSSGVRLALATLILLIGIATIVIALAHRDDPPAGAGADSEADGGPTRSRVPGRSG